MWGDPQKPPLSQSFRRQVFYLCIKSYLCMSSLLMQFSCCKIALKVLLVGRQWSMNLSRRSLWVSCSHHPLMKKITFWPWGHGWVSVLPSRFINKWGGSGGSWITGSSSGSRALYLLGEDLLVLSLISHQCAVVEPILVGSMYPNSFSVFFSLPHIEILWAIPL